MKISEGFIMKNIAGANVVLAVGEAAERFNGTVTLNCSATQLWCALEQGASEDDLVKILLDTYDVDEETARHDVQTLVSKLFAHGIVSE